MHACMQFNGAPITRQFVKVRAGEDEKPAAAAAAAPAAKPEGKGKGKGDAKDDIV